MFHRNAAKKAMNTTILGAFIFLLFLGFSNQLFAQKPDYPDWFLGTESFSDLSFDPINAIPITISTNPTGEKPQSKVWFHAGKWWAVFPTNSSGAPSSGTWIFRRDGSNWSANYKLSSDGDVKADCKSIGGVTHVLLYRGSSNELISVEYNPATDEYEPWSHQPTVTSISLSGSETAVIDIDTEGRMWLASNDGTDMFVRWSDFPYDSFSGDISIGSGSSDDICAMVAMPNAGRIGLIWSNQSDFNFYFRYHTDGNSPGTWSSTETISGSGDFADDHMNMAVAEDGKLYVAVKTSTNDMVLLVRSTSGNWDTHLVAASTGTRPIVLLNNKSQTVSVVYQSANGNNPILYREAPMSNPGNFGTQTTLISGSYSNVSSTKQAYVNELVVIAAERNASPGDLVGVFGVGTSPQQQFEETFTSGWNLVGLPSDIVDSNYLGLFPKAETSTLFSYSGGYTNELHMNEGTGYWVKFVSSGSAVFTGDAINTNDLDLASGWNLISGISCTVALDDVTDNGSIIEPGTLFGFSGGGYVASDIIEQGKGYWIYANSAGTITLDCDPPVSPLAKSRSAAHIRSELQLDERPQLVFSNATGTTQTLYFATEIAPDAMAPFQLPPVAPFPSFDVRYPNDTRLTGDESPVMEVRLIDRTVLSARNLPLESGESYVLDLMAGRQVVESIPVSEGETITLDQPYLTAIQLRKSLEINNVITGFAVEQNYPNPFNPQTEIRFRIPQNEYVEIRIFNTIGQEVRNLLAENREAGSHKIIWNGLDNGGGEVASGTYFYSVVAGEHHIVKRMVLLR